MDNSRKLSEVWMFEARDNGSAADGESGRAVAAAAVEREVVGLYDEHAAALHRFAAASGAAPALAQDAVQEAFLRYFLCRGSGNGPAQPKVWLFQFVREYVESRVAEQDDGGWDRLAAEPPVAEGAGEPEGRPWEEALAGLSSLLTPREKECLRLRAEGLAYRDIAKVLNISLGNVSAKLSRAVRKLQIHVWRENR